MASERAYRRRQAGIEEDHRRDSERYAAGYRHGHDAASERIKALEAQVAALEHEMGRARRCIAHLRALREVEREEHRTRIERLQGNVAMYRERSLRLEVEWRKCSEVIRFCVTPEELDGFRRFWQGNFPLETPIYVGPLEGVDAPYQPTRRKADNGEPVRSATD